MKSLFDPLANPYSPIVVMMRHVVENYYERTVSDAELACKFKDYFLSGIDLAATLKVLDHGCGRGRLIGLLAQLGMSVAAQDVAAHRWWSRFPNTEFQIISQDCDILPWPSECFDIVFDFEVVQYFAPGRLARLVDEVGRILRPGGYWIVWGPNPCGRGFQALRRLGQIPFCYKPEDIVNMAAGVNLEYVDCRYDNVSSMYFPRLTAAVHVIRSGNSFDYFSYGQDRQRAIRPEEKRMYVIRLRRR